MSNPLTAKQARELQLSSMKAEVKSLVEDCLFQIENHVKSGDSQTYIVFEFGADEIHLRTAFENKMNELGYKLNHIAEAMPKLAFEIHWV
jgi:hypothetical protein